MPTMRAFVIYPGGVYDERVVLERANTATRPPACGKPGSAFGPVVRPGVRSAVCCRRQTTVEGAKHEVVLRLTSMRRGTA